MTNIKTKEKLIFKSALELYSFMDQQSDEDFDIYSRLYNTENPKWSLIKKDGKSTIVKFIQEVKKERINVVTFDSLNCLSLNGNFAYYECVFFDGKIKVNLDKNENFIKNLASSNIDSIMWDKLVKQSA